MNDPATLYIDPYLTDFSVGYQDQELIGRDLFPETPVNTQSGRYYVFDRSSWLIYDDRREPGTVANEIQGAKWSYDTFFTKEHSLQAPVYDEERQQLASLGGVDLDINPERDAVGLVTQSILLKHEKRVADAIRLAGNYAGGNTVTLSGTGQFNDYTNSDPITVIRTGMRAVYNATGRYPNTIVIPDPVWETLTYHTKIVDRYKTFRLTMDEAFLELTRFTGRVIVPRSKYNAANNIDATENITDMWGKDIWMGLVDPTPGQRTKTFGKTFAQKYQDGSIRPVERWREEPRKTDLFRTSYKYDLKVVSNTAGYLIKNAIA